MPDYHRSAWLPFPASRSDLRTWSAADREPRRRPLIFSVCWRSPVPPLAGHFLLGIVHHVGTRSPADSPARPKVPPLQPQTATEPIMTSADRKQPEIP